ncbi:transcription termination factor 2, mitochondrial [Pristis pectinata]|uniref:transcription termination factor 2, mitochondrial n=1 Tax=Pristis pectinata TaxID=685728 RepID=UPI00223E5780|nr:transcription termination factor 2, mitochondrial [Pristis pectinata]
MYGAISLRRMLGVGLLRSGQCREWSPLWSGRTSQGRAQFVSSRAEGEENQRTVNSLHSLSVDVARVRQLKRWVLLADEAYVSETADILKEMGAKERTVARILQRCPEAVLCAPVETSPQRELWASLCPNKEELLRIVEQFPDSFFISRNAGNWQDNIEYLQQLNLNKRMISRLLATCPQAFSNNVRKNRAVVETLQQTFLQLGGTQANMNIWLMKLLSQNPFTLLKPPETVGENLACLQLLGFSKAECLQLLTKLKGLILELSPPAMEESVGFCERELHCSGEGLRQLVLRCPGLLYCSVAVLQERLSVILGEGFSVEQVKGSPAVLEVSAHILRHRIRKLRSLGYSVERDSLALLDGTRKDFEASCGKMEQRRERPLFNPAAPLNIED